MSELPELEESDRKPERVRAWYHPASLVGAFTKRKYDNDAHTRELVKLAIQGGGISIALVSLFLVYVGMTRVTTALDGVSSTLTVHSKALNDHLAEDLIDKVAMRTAEMLQPKEHQPRTIPFQARPEPQTRVTKPKVSR
jgi:hypothetical protein